MSAEDGTHVSRASAVTLHDDVAVLAMDERVEHLRHRIQATLLILRDEPSRQCKGNGRLRRQAERVRRGRRANVDVLEEILESDRRELDTDLRGVGDAGLESEVDTASRVVAGKIERLDLDTALQAVHALQRNLLVVQLNPGDRDTDGGDYE